MDTFTWQEMQAFADLGSLTSLSPASVSRPTPAHTPLHIKVSLVSTNQQDPNQPKCFWLGMAWPSFLISWRRHLELSNEAWFPTQHVQTTCPLFSEIRGEHLTPKASTLTS